MTSITRLIVISTFKVKGGRGFFRIAFSCQVCGSYLDFNCNRIKGTAPYLPNRNVELSFDVQTCGKQITL